MFRKTSRKAVLAIAVIYPLVAAAQDEADDANAPALEEEDSGPSAKTGAPVPGAGVPEVYTVEKGDTLWDLCQRFLNNPWYWPKVWSYNPRITNPHWIYPGDEVYFYPQEGQRPVPLQGPEPLEPLEVSGPELPSVSVAPPDQPILLDESGAAQSGVVDYWLEQPLVGQALDLRDYYYRVSNPNVIGRGEILVFPAGRFGASYPGKLARLDFTPPAQGEHPLVTLLRQARDELHPDWILLDSRAGISEAAGFALGGLGGGGGAAGAGAGHVWRGGRDDRRGYHGAAERRRVQPGERRAGGDDGGGGATRCPPGAGRGRGALVPRWHQL